MTADGRSGAPADREGGRQEPTPGVLRWRSVDELARSVQSGAVTPGDLLREAIELLNTVGRPLNAVAAVLDERARREVELLDRRGSRGVGTSVLSGLPYGAKDIIAARGANTTWGSRYFADQTFSRDAVVVDRLRRAGAILCAKLTTSELAGAGRAGNRGSSLHGAGRNPWAPSRYSGGSSSGSAVAVAAGIVPFALGTETAGSLLGPAAYCGVTAVRPTRGAVPRVGVMRLSDTLDKVGVLARSARDCEVVLDALKGRHHEDVTERSAIRPLRPGAEREQPRLGCIWETVRECPSGSREAAAEGVDQWRRVHGDLEDVDLAADPAYDNALEKIMLAEATFHFRDHLAVPTFRLIDDQQDADFRKGVEMTATEYQASMRVRTRARSLWRELFSGIDVILAVSRPTTAPAFDERRRRAETLSDTVRASSNLLGLPAVGFPCGLAADGLPVGLQLIGRPHSEATLLRLTARFQTVTKHHLARPEALEAELPG